MEVKRMKMFSETPIWKLVLKMSIPSIIIMSIIGLYTFSDSILAINFASDSVPKEIIAAGKGYMEPWRIVRMIMTYSQPTFNLLLAMTLTFTVGVSTRVSINLGRGDKARAINTIKTGMFFGIILMFISIPLFVLTAKPWVEFQLGTAPVPAGVKKYIIDQTYKYIWILAIANPMYFFANLVSSLFRVEGRMREAGISMLLPVIFNLFMDWLFMGPLGMGIEGAALATTAAEVITFIIILGIMLRIRKSTIITFHNMFGKFNWRSIIGILIVGISPFFRNFAQSITGSIQQNVIADVQTAVYGGSNNPMKMIAIITAAFPIFGLFFPMMFGFVQGASPIAGFNYGAKNIDRVKKTILYATLYAFIFALIIYGLSAGALTIPLLKVLKVDYSLFPTARKTIAILMIGAPLFVPAIGGMILFTSTDRVLFAFISSIARGFLFFLPMLFVYKAISIANPTHEFIFWGLFPTISFLSGALILIMGSFTWRKMGQKHKTLDERINEINQKLQKRK